MSEPATFSGWAVASKSYRFVFAHLNDAARTTAAWYVVVLALSFTYYPGIYPLLQSLAFPQQAIVGWLLFSLLSVLIATAYASVAVCWHRFMLRREPPRVLFLLSAQTWICLPLLAVAFLAMYVAVWGVTGFIAAVSYFDVAAFSAITVIGLAATGFSLRYGLKLPALAIEDSGMTLRRARLHTDQILTRFLWGAALAWVPALVVGQATTRVVMSMETLLTYFVATAAYYAITFVGLLLYATYLSLSYEFLAGDVGSVFD